ncbi:MAG: FAD-binding oxidoreductase [Candidatus Doudnabacteria bacterium]|nr:FAD-binding oxidoreductase [Candidatus Doudnabacteria bacterium]
MQNISDNLKAFSHTLKGKIIFPDDVEYNKARQVFPGELDRKPACIVRVTDAEDIKKIIIFAKENNLEVCVRSGGHSATGACVVNGAVVIDLRDMKRMEVNTTEQTAWIESGMTAGEVTTELDKHNFVLGFGDAGSVGVGGITLGGGVGFLVRKFGLTIDNLLAAEIITADGQTLLADSKTNPDLFWAIRGGGGNFGIATKFKFQLHKLENCYGGMLFLPATPEVIWKAVDIAKKAPEELSVIYNIMPMPPMPFIPAQHHGKLCVMALAVYAGSPTEGEKALSPLRALAAPLADMLKPMRYKDIYFPENPDYHPKAVSKNLHLDNIDEELAEKIVAHLNSLNAQMKVLQLRVLGGAMARVGSFNTAYAHRSSAIMANVASFYETEQEKQERKVWADEFLKLLDQGDKAVYANFLGQYDDKERIKEAYPGKTWDRLLEIKKKYDPTNFFHNNANIHSEI